MKPSGDFDFPDHEGPHVNLFPIQRPTVKKNIRILPF